MKSKTKLRDRVSTQDLVVFNSGPSDDRCLEHKASSEASHATDRQLGGTSKRKRHLPLIADLHGLVIDNVVPRTRGECPTGICGHVKCRHNLLRRDDPPGRPGLAGVPRGEHGHTERVVGKLAEKSAPMLDASAWVTLTPRPSCALAVADRGALTNEQLAEVFGVFRTTVAKVVWRALAKLKAAGVSIEELELVLKQEEEKHL